MIWGGEDGNMVWFHRLWYNDESLCQADMRFAMLQ